MSKLTLQFNALVGPNHLPEIEAITKRLSLAIDSVREESPISGKKLKFVSVSGTPENLIMFRAEMRRFPSITLKEERTGFIRRAR
jgi:hypothetical protein